MMTPAEALETVKSLLSDDDQFSDTKPRDEALIVLDRLVSKDAAEGKHPTPARSKPQCSKRYECTCQTTIPCKVWGHT